MKTTSAASALAATAGLAALSSISPVSSYVLPQSVGDQWFAEKAAQQAAAQSNSRRAEEFAAFPASKRDETKSIRMQLMHSRKEELNTPEKVKDFALRQKTYVEAKFGNHAENIERRQTIGLTDVGPDTFYYAQLSVGTPAQNFNAILDTGSADFWLADSSCDDSQCSGIALYNAGASSTNVRSSTPFQIVYGSGAVRGTLFADTVSLAGYTVYNQTAAGVDQLAQNTIQAPASGIMGMGFQTLTTSGATPFWEVLAETNKLQTQAFTFQLQRNALASSTALNSGGVFTLGQIDANQYSGDITYINLPNTRSGRAGYWAIPMDSIEVAGQTINTNEGLAAIDTGTTLIGGPQDAVNQIYESIQGAQPVNLGGSSSASMGYYAYPCSANPSISITFGGREFSINSQDFNAGALDTSGRYCLGAIFATDLGQGAPEWIVGDSFLKNVFSVYDYNNGNPRVGFASLKGSSAQNVAVTTGAVPSGTAANQIPTSAAGGSSTAPVGPPSISIDSSAASNTAIVGGSGLPAPVAAASNAASTNPSALTPSSSTSAPPSSSSTSPSLASSDSSPISIITSDPSTASSASQASLTTQSDSQGSTSGATAASSFSLLGMIGAAGIGAALLL